MFYESQISSQIKDTQTKLNLRISISLFIKKNEGNRKIEIHFYTFSLQIKR